MFLERRCDRNGTSSAQSAYWATASSASPPPYETDFYSGTCSPGREVHEIKYADLMQHHSLQQPSLVNDKPVINHGSVLGSATSHNGECTNAVGQGGNAQSAGCLEGFSDEGALEQLRVICLQQAASDVQVACHMLNISPSE